MKKLYILSMVAFSISLMLAQTPQKMSYQAVIRNASNVLVTNTVVGMRISILQSSVTGTVVYSETDEVTTNANGLATLEIGNVSPDIGNFEEINWAAGPYYIKTETDVTGNNLNYTISGTTELLSVPYALLSEKAVKPTNPVFVSSESLGAAETQRNTWIDVPNLSVTAPESGQYTINFYGTASNFNTYSPAASVVDYNCRTQLYVNDELNVLFPSMIVINSSLYFNASEIIFYMPVQVSRFKTLHLNAGDVIKGHYMQDASATAPTGDWYIGLTGISILKVGDF